MKAAQIGDEPKRYEVYPLPISVPIVEPSPEPVTAPTKEPERVH